MNSFLRLASLRGTITLRALYYCETHSNANCFWKPLKFKVYCSGRYGDQLVRGVFTISHFSTSAILRSDLQSSLSSKKIEEFESFPFWNSVPSQHSAPFSKPEIKSDVNVSPSSDPSSDKPKSNKPKNEIAKPPLWQRVKKELLHYYHGFRLLGLEVKIASGMCFRVFLGHKLTRRERKQLVRTVADIIRLVPFAVFIIVPFMEFLLPFYLKFFPFMLPSTFKDKSADADKIQQRLKAKLEMTRFLQETLIQTTGTSKGNSDAPTVSEFQEFIKKVQETGQPANTEEITRFSKLFEDQVTLESLDNKQLRMLCQILSLPTIGPNHLLRFQIWMRVRQLKAEDRLLAKEGVDQIPPWELQSLCQERGMRSVGLSQERLRSQLSQWLTLHLEKNVPITLLLFSRALHVTQRAVDELPLLQAIAQLPSSASEEAAARVLETTPHADLDPKMKIDVLRKEQENIKAARAQRKQELALQQKAEAEQAKVSATTVAAVPASEVLVDKAPLVQGLSNEDLEKVTSADALNTAKRQDIKEQTKVEADLAKSTMVSPEPDMSLIQEPLTQAPPIASAKVVEPPVREVETEISVKDLAEIESAIATSSPALQEEALHGLKEEVAETAKLQQKHQAELISSEKIVDKRTTKAATRLEARLDRLIKEMDTMITKLGDERMQLLKDIELREVHMKHSTKPSEKSEILDAIQADQDRVVDLNDLMLSLKRIQKVPDDTKWQRILEVLDEDHDGKIELKHVLSLRDNQVLELLGTGNVKLTSKEITRVLEMIDNEQLANIIEQTEDSSSSSNQKISTPTSNSNESSSDLKKSDSSVQTPFSLPKSTKSDDKQTDIN